MLKNLYFILLLLSHSTLLAQDYLPTSNTNQIIHHTHYSLSYSEAYEQAEWIYYELTASEANNNSFKRSNNFREDAKVKTGSASLADYKGSGYDRGHLAPAGDMAFNSTAMSESFYMSNMSPQHPSFNRGIWKKLESLTRAWATEYSTLYIATGAILEPNLSTIGPNRVSVPNYYYKAILDYDETSGAYRAIAFILPNQKGKRSLQSYVVSIDNLESRTGIDFYPQLADEFENSIAANYDLDNWHWSAKGVKNYSSKTTAPAPQCAGNTQKGARCKNKTRNESEYCYLHESKVNEGKKKSAPEKMTTSLRYSGTTKAGSRCKRKTLSANGKCWQHGSD
jgi:endonuclease G